MRLPHAEDLSHLSDADRFKAAMKHLVSVTPEQYAAAEAKQKTEQQASGKRKPGPKTKNGSAKPHSP